MATVYTDAQGNVLRYTGTIIEDTQLGGQPAGTASTLDFDPSTNPTVDTGLRTAPGNYTLLSGTLRQSGQVVTVNAASTDYQTCQLAKQVVNALKGAQFQGATLTLPQMNAAFQAVEAGTATETQQNQLMVSICRLFGVVLNRLITNGTLP